jgi:hypothetical protein
VGATPRERPIERRHDRLAVGVPRQVGRRAVEFVLDAVARQAVEHRLSGTMDRHQLVDERFVQVSLLRGRQAGYPRIVEGHRGGHMAVDGRHDEERCPDPTCVFDEGHRYRCRYAVVRGNALCTRLHRQVVRGKGAGTGRCEAEGQPFDGAFCRPEVAQEHLTRQALVGLITSQALVRRTASGLQPAGEPVREGRRITHVGRQRTSTHS